MGALAWNPGGQEEATGSLLPAAAVAALLGSDGMLCTIGWRLCKIGSEAVHCTLERFLPADGPEPEPDRPLLVPLPGPSCALPAGECTCLGPTECLCTATLLREAPVSACCSCACAGLPAAAANGESPPVCAAASPHCTAPPSSPTPASSHGQLATHSCSMLFCGAVETASEEKEEEGEEEGCAREEACVLLFGHALEEGTEL